MQCNNKINTKYFQGDILSVQQKMRSEFAFAQSLHLQTSKIDNMVGFFKIRTGLMAHLRLMTINTASTF